MDTAMEFKLNILVLTETGLKEEDNNYWIGCSGLVSKNFKFYNSPTQEGRGADWDCYMIDIDQWVQTKYWWQILLKRLSGHWNVINRILTLIGIWHPSQWARM